MQIDRMRISKDGEIHPIKEVYKMQNGVKVPVYVFSKTLITDDVCIDGVQKTVPWYQRGALDADDNVTSYDEVNIYEAESVDNDNYEYRYFQMSVEVVGKDANPLVTNSYCDLVVSWQGGSFAIPGGNIEYSATISGKLLKDEFYADGDIVPGDPINASYINIYKRKNSSEDKDIDYTIQKLIFVK